MRMIIAGVEINEAVIDVIDTLQNIDGIRRLYLDNINRLARMLVETADETNLYNSEIIEYIRVLQMIRNDIEILAYPPGINNPENDKAIIMI